MTWHLSFKEKLAYGFGGVGKDFVYGVTFSFYTIYLNQVVGLNPLITGFFFFGARIFDGFNDPFIGTLVDNTRSRWGKSRPWMALGVILNSVVLVLMFSGFDLTLLGKYYFYLSMYLLWAITYSLMDIPYWSLIPAITSTKNERNTISSLARLFSYGGIALSGVVVPILIGNNWSMENFFNIGLISALLSAFTMFFTIFFVRERVTLPGIKIGFRDVYKVFSQNDQLLAYIFTFGLFYLSSQVMSMAGVYYFQIVLQRVELMSLFFLIGGVGGAGISMSAYPFLAKKFGRRNIYLFAMAITVLGFTIMSFFSYFWVDSELILIPLFIGSWLVLFALGIAAVGSTVMLADVVDYGEWKNGNRTENIIFSAQCFLYKFAGAFTSVIIGVTLMVGKIPTLDKEGIPTAEVTELGINAIIFSLFTLPIFFVIPAAIIYMKYYKLNGKYHDNILKELSAKRELV